MIKLLSSGIALCLLSVSLLGCQQQDRAALEGVSLAQVELESVAGELVDFNELQGKTLVVNFWATWCAPCREEMPALESLSEQLDSERFQVIGISVDQDLNLVREFVLKYGISFQQLTDASMKVSSDLLNIEAFPQTLIVSPLGVVQKQVVGVRDWADPQYYRPLLSMEP